MAVPGLSELYAGLKTDDARINAMIHESCQWGR